MDTNQAREQLRDAGVGAWRMTVLVVATLLVVMLYVGMAYLVYRGQVADGPLVLFTGVILGYLLHAAQGLL